MKGIAVRTIILMVIGLLIAGVVVFMVYKYVVGAPLSEQECRSRVIAWCNGCRVMNFTTGGINMTKDLKECVKKYFDPSMNPDSITNCITYSGDNNPNKVFSFCKAFTP